ncbi:MAG: hypothetical protein GX554_04375 [Elusimicrobia bacterium]|jgi:hypothetical protein|nr:hypothetical protein [Elusimicrobiota bacterium]
MKTPTRWIIIILVLSGWIVSGVLYVNSQNKQAKTETEKVILETELQAYQLFAKDIEDSTEKIDDMIKALEGIKDNFEKIKNQMERGSTQK